MTLTANVWGSTSTQAATVALRPAGVDDAEAVHLLAELDDAPMLDGEDVLLALLDGQVVAALSLRDGRVVANPFVRTADAVALLRARAKQLTGVGRRLLALRSPASRARPRRCRLG